MHQYARAHIRMEDGGDHDVFYPDQGHARTSAALLCTYAHANSRVQYFLYLIYKKARTDTLISGVSSSRLQDCT